MRYQKFVIRNYRAIVGPMEIELHKSRLMPIIGINESGKTTILHAVFAFDYFNDNLNDNGRHLMDVVNLYRTTSGIPEVEAEVKLSRDDLVDAAEECADENAEHKASFSVLARKRNLPTTVRLIRDLNTKKYRIDPEVLGSPDLQNVLARKIIATMPYILYFDDFRDKVAERIEIPPESSENLSGWPAIIEQLFIQTDPAFSIRKLASMEERQRKTVLSKVERKLNATLTREWHAFKLDDREALKISIDFEQESAVRAVAASPAPPQRAVPQVSTGQSQPARPAQSQPATVPITVTRNFVKLDIVETDSSGDEHFFFISDRSKGFYWFFNFVMKLEFNPKVVSGAPSVYLLDEPGSYLHAFAQRKLCQKLRDLSTKSWVAYCTHSHYLLDPEVIPVNSVTVAEKDGSGAISLVPLTSYKNSISEKRSALQPVFDALQIKPFALDIPSTRATVITEGIYDYFALELFRDGRDISILPSVGADSIKYYISLMIAWQIDFRALWDNDPEGNRRLDEATEKFGAEIARKCFRLIRSDAHGSRCILQNLFDGRDLSLMRTEMGLAGNCSFERTLQAVFYSPRRAEVVAQVGSVTKDSFGKLFAGLDLG
jgi:hypothetical protein